MTYVIPYEAEFECPKGHRFTAPASPFGGSEARCTVCYEEWIAANVPNGRQVSEARQAHGRLQFD